MELSTHVNRGLTISSLDELSRVANMAAKTAFVPRDFQGKPESCTLAMMAGLEVGFTPIQACQSIAVVNGRPTIWGDAAKALCVSSSCCEYITEFFEGEGDKLTAVCIAKRKGYPEPHRVTFSVADAKAAELWGKSGPWKQYAKRMLQMRARGFALRDVFPDVLRGLVTAEEAGDYTIDIPPQPPAPVTVSQPEPVAKAPKMPPSEKLKQKAIDAVDHADTTDELNRIRDKVEAYLKDGHMTPADADEVFNEVANRQDALEPAEVD